MTFLPLDVVGVYGWPLCKGFTTLVRSMTYNTTSQRFPQSSIKFIFRRKTHEGLFAKSNVKASN